jgi:ankyrin repeat protein
MIVRYAPEQSIYDDPLLLLDITKLVRTLFRASTVSADGKLFGTDKIVHFINLGEIYHSAYLAARKQGLSDKEAIARMLLNTSGDFFLSEDYMLGGVTTGIHSNADLAADYSGFKFYRNLTEAVRIGNRVLPPILVRDGLYWRFNAHVQPDSDFFTAFITPHWNEVLNPNVYGFTSRARLRAIVRSRCADVIDWYRDEHGQRLSQKQFEQLEQELSTFYGEEYGYQSDGKDRVSVANTCFESGPSTAASGNAPDAAGDLRMQNAFGLQPGWGGGGGVIKVSVVDRSQAAAVDRFGRTQLWWAAEDGRLDEVKRLLAQGADPNAGDLDGETALHAAARWGRMDIVQALLAAGANPSVKALYGVTPLQLSVQSGELAVARTLLRYKAEVNLRDLFGNSPLHNAVLRGNPDLVALLLEFGADPGLADDSGTTPLQLATRGHQDAVVKILTTPRAIARDKDWIGATPCDGPEPEGQRHGCPN